MPVTLLNCSYCGKSVYRDNRQVNEGRKFGWRVFCSQNCLSQSKIVSREYTCSRPGCDKVFMRAPSDRKRSKFFYCSQRCSALVTNLTRKKKVRICPACRKEFTESRIYCSYDCVPRHKSKYSERIVIQQIEKFYKEHKRIPVKREMYGAYKVARKYFGTWNYAIKAAGFAPNPVMFAKKYIANDGDKCDSLAEKIIDDYLSARNIKHVRNFPYPGDKKFTVDFKVSNFWIEFFGLSGELKRYDEIKEEKLLLAKKENLNLIKIYPRDLFPMNKLSTKFVSFLRF